MLPAHLQVVVERDEVAGELAGKLERAESDRQSLADQLSAAERQLAGLQLEKHDVEKSAGRLELDKAALIKTLDKVCHCRTA